MSVTLNDVTWDRLTMWVEINAMTYAGNPGTLEYMEANWMALDGLPQGACVRVRVCCD